MRLTSESLDNWRHMNTKCKTTTTMKEKSADGVNDMNQHLIKTNATLSKKIKRKIIVYMSVAVWQLRRMYSDNGIWCKWNLSSLSTRNEHDIWVHKLQKIEEKLIGEQIFSFISVESTVFYHKHSIWNYSF